MSCVAVAVPLTISVYNLVATAVGTGIAMYATYKHASNELKDLNEVSQLCSTNDHENTELNQEEEISIITDCHFLEKSFETCFMDKDLMLKTLEEHGVQNLKENEWGQISGRLDNYKFTFERMEADKPYFMKMTCLENDNAEEKFNNLTSEYAINVQEQSYNSIVEKLKANNMEIENEEVYDDNTIVLTINLD